MNAVEVLQQSSPGRGGLRLLDLASRTGYVARGVVYVSVGLIALLAAMGIAPRPRGPIAALEAWGQWPMGIFLLWLIAFGLAAFSGWRILQSVFDAEAKGWRLYAACGRVGQAFSAIMYAALSFSAFKLIDAIVDLHQVDDEARTRAVIQRLLDLPHGAALVLWVGIAAVAIGLGNLIQSVARTFGKRLTSHPKFTRRARVLARFGYGARGIVFILVGASVVAAGAHASSLEAQSAGGALSYLRSMPFGDALLASTAAGLIAFGLFAFVEARYRDLGLVRREAATLRGDVR